MTLFKHVTDKGLVSMSAKEESDFENARAPQPMSTAEIQAEKTLRVAALDWAMVSDADISPTELAKFISHRAQIRGVPTTPRPHHEVVFPSPDFDIKRNGR